ncbi:hypothetical protein NDU88_001338 [Pleurodeles waltl]|uniref:YDG domain-containing protein n=1 Tax=Pleurodeles waltl TaxID=8319 RepID=A0AAV7VZ65_PLEWA|nr:hypothetical protein NDU88_001338 [Pleurodeles waltl]
MLNTRVLSGGFKDEVDRGDEFTYTGNSGRDISEEMTLKWVLGRQNEIEQYKKLGTSTQFLAVYLEAMANKEKKAKVKRQTLEREPGDPDSESNQDNESSPSNPVDLVVVSPLTLRLRRAALVSTPRLIPAKETRNGL